MSRTFTIASTLTRYTYTFRTSSPIVASTFPDRIPASVLYAILRPMYCEIVVIIQLYYTLLARAMRRIDRAIFAGNALHGNSPDREKNVYNREHKNRAAADF